MSQRTKRARAKVEEADAKKIKAGPAVGDTCPDFELETDESGPDSESKISLKDMVKDNGVVIFAYPRANTSGCTTQACGFRDKFDAIEKAGYKVYGLSADKPRSQANWRKKHKFQYNLLCDTTHEVLEKLGMLKPGKKIARSHIVIEKGGLIKDIKIGISPKNSFLEAVKTIMDKTPVKAPAEKAGTEAAESAKEPEQKNESKADDQSADDKVDVEDAMEEDPKEPSKEGEAEVNEEAKGKGEEIEVSEEKGEHVGEPADANKPAEENTEQEEENKPKEDNTENSEKDDKESKEPPQKNVVEGVPDAGAGEKKEEEGNSTMDTGAGGQEK